MQNSPKTGFHPCLRRSVLEDVCIYNNGILEVFTSRSTTSSSNSSNNHTTIISSKLICFNNWIDLSNSAPSALVLLVRHLNETSPRRTYHLCLLLCMLWRCPGHIGVNDFRHSLWQRLVQDWIGCARACQQEGQFDSFNVHLAHHS